METIMGAVTHTRIEAQATIATVCVTLIIALAAASSTAQTTTRPDGKRCFDILKTYAMSPGPPDAEGRRVAFKTRRWDAVPGFPPKDALDILDVSGEVR